MKNKKIITIIIVIAVIGAIVGGYFLYNKTQESKIDTSEFNAANLKGVVTGIDERYVLKGHDPEKYLTALLYKDSIVKEVKVSASEVDYNKTGEYDITYTVTVDSKAMEAHIKGEEIEGTDSPKFTYDIEAKGKIIVVDEDGAKELRGKGKYVYGYLSENASKISIDELNEATGGVYEDALQDAEESAQNTETDNADDIQNSEGNETDNVQNTESAEGTDAQ